MTLVHPGARHAAQPPEVATQPVRRAFRPDVQGLRAVAVLLVVLYHCGVTVVGGGYVGVDVFFVISGFLITLHLVDEVDRTGRVSISDFYARRIRRLLPPALVVIVATVVAARIWGPVLDSTRTAWDGLASAFYVMNYRLADQGIDYQQVNAAPSPLQHFWSLAVEEQFYIVWPLLIVAFAVVTRRARPVVRRSLLAVALAGVVAASLYTSITVTEVNAPLAYYSLQTRAWELGVGALLAVALPLVARTPRLLAVAATWVGLGLVVVAAGTFDDTTAFPGSAALIPVAGAALIIAGGVVASPWGVVRVLRGRLVQFIGHVSYGWYLWHWPVIILGPSIFGKELTTLENLELCVIALWFATLTYLLVEQPTLRLRLDFKRWLGVAAGMSSIVVATSVAAVAMTPDVQGDGAQVVRADATSTSALDRSLEEALTTTAVPRNLQPALDVADGDVPPTSKDGCHVELLATAQPACVYGDPTAARTILLFGDSHAEQWFGALDAYAKSEGWRLVSWTKVACPLADTTIENQELGRAYTECDTWRAERMAAIERMKPDVIVAGQADTLVPFDYSNDRWAAATRTTLASLAVDTGDLVFLEDIPRPTEDVPGCLARHLDDAGSCEVPSDPGLVGGGTDYGHLPARHAALRSATDTVDLTRVDTQAWLCRGESCPAVVGDTLVYRDEAHITQAYSRFLTPVIGDVISASRTSTDKS